MAERAVTSVVPVVGFTAHLVDVAATTSYPSGDVAVSSTVPNGAFGSRATDFSGDFAHGTLHVLAVLDVSAGTPSFGLTLLGRARNRVPTVDGQNTPEWIVWSPLRVLNGGNAINATNNPESVASSTRLVYQEPVFVDGASRQYMVRVNSIGGTTPLLDVYLAFSRG